MDWPGLVLSDLNVMLQLKAVLLLGQYSTHDQKEEYEVRSNLKNFTMEEDRALYCVHFLVTAAARMCRSEPLLSGLGSGEEVCVLCTSKAVRRGEERCQGSGVFGRVTQWRMFLQPQCSGTWRQSLQSHTCHCQPHQSFLFV